MTIWGLHIIDLVIIFLFLVFLIWVGQRVSKQNKDPDDFFLTPFYWFSTAKTQMAMTPKPEYEYTVAEKKSAADITNT